MVSESALSKDTKPLPDLVLRIAPKRAARVSVVFPVVFLIIWTESRFSVAGADLLGQLIIAAAGTVLVYGSWMGVSTKITAEYVETRCAPFPRRRFLWSEIYDITFDKKRDEYIKIHLDADGQKFGGSTRRLFMPTTFFLIKDPLFKERHAKIVEYWTRATGRTRSEKSSI
jgi:hypothetical protein